MPLLSQLLQRRAMGPQAPEVSPNHNPTEPAPTAPASPPISLPEPPAALAAMPARLLGVVDGLILQLRPRVPSWVDFALTAAQRAAKLFGQDIPSLDQVINGARQYVVSTPEAQLREQLTHLATMIAHVLDEPEPAASAPEEPDVSNVFDEESAADVSGTDQHAQ